MPTPLRILLLALAVLVVSGGIALLAMFALAVTAGPTIQAGERAAVRVGVANIGIGLVAMLVFWFGSRALSTLPRVLVAGAFAVVEFLLLALLFVLSLVLLNR